MTRGADFANAGSHGGYAYAFTLVFGDRGPYSTDIPMRLQRVSPVSSLHQVSGFSIDHQLPWLFHDQ